MGTVSTLLEYRSLLYHKENKLQVYAYSLLWYTMVRSTEHKNIDNH